MASILDKYGIKEVADVVFYELDSKGAPSAPALYLDSLKVSTIEQSAETVDATGGKGNVKLLTWDTNKEITLTLEDALFSAKSLGIMFGGTMTNNGANQEVLKTLRFNEVTSKTGTGGATYWQFTIKDINYAIDKRKCTYFVYRDNDQAHDTTPTPVPLEDVTATNPASWDFVTFDLLDATKVPASGTIPARGEGNGIVSKGITIDITSNFDSNTYYITGDTFARNFESGKDEFLQFIVPKGKVSAEDVSLTMEADGDPATFSMTVNCLKANDGSMIKLVKYTLGEEATTSNYGTNKGVASVLDHYNGPNQRDKYAQVNSSVASDVGSLMEGTDITDEG